MMLMGYKCHNFCDGEVLKAEALNCIEQGIVDVEKMAVHIESTEDGQPVLMQDGKDVTTEMANIVIAALPVYGGEVEEVVALISFSIMGVSYQATEGMTWGEWIESEYNTDGYVINPSSGAVSWVDDDDNYYSVALDEDSDSVKETDVIIANHDYYELA